MTAQPSQETDEDFGEEEEKGPIEQVAEVLTGKRKGKDALGMGSMAETLLSGKSSGISGSDLLAIMLLNQADDRRWQRYMLEKKDQDREEQRKRETQVPLTREGLLKLLSEEDEVPSRKKAELPPEFIELKKTVDTISQVLAQDTETKKTKEFIEQVQSPLMAKMDDWKKTIGVLEKRVDDLTKGGLEGIGGAKGIATLGALKDLLKDVKETAELMGMKQNNPDNQIITRESGLLDGIPVHGSLPAWTVAVPVIFQRLFEEFDKRAQQWGLFGGPPPENVPPEQPIISMPPKPRPIRAEPKQPIQSMLTMPSRTEPEPEKPVNLVIKRVERPTFLAIPGKTFIETVVEKVNPDEVSQPLIKAAEETIPTEQSPAVEPPPTTSPAVETTETKPSETDTQTKPETQTNPVTSVTNVKPSQEDINRAKAEMEKQSSVEEKEEKEEKGQVEVKVVEEQTVEKKPKKRGPK